MKEIIVKQFSTDKEMYQWLSSANLDKLKEQYPPSRYKAMLRLVDKQVVIIEKVGFRIIKPPHEIPKNIPFSVFLAGSIEMGKAGNWQEVVENELRNSNITILNPRRDEWDSTWEQKITNPQFKGQVTWELYGQDIANVIAMYFDPNTKSPITLLELGLFAKTKKLIVCCPEGFWRKGNVDIVCERYGIKQVNTLQEMIDEIKAIEKASIGMLGIDTK